MVETHYNLEVKNTQYLQELGDQSRYTYPMLHKPFLFQTYITYKYTLGGDVTVVHGNMQNLSFFIIY